MVDAGLRKGLLHLGRGTYGDDEIGRTEKLALQKSEFVVRVARKRGDRKRIACRSQPAPQDVYQLARVISSNVLVGQDEQDAPAQDVVTARQDDGSDMRPGTGIALPRQTFRHAARLGKGEPRRLAYLADGRQLLAALQPSERDFLFQKVAQGVHQGGGAVWHEVEVIEDVSHGAFL